jgi:hypothetical protein
MKLFEKLKFFFNPSGKQDAERKIIEIERIKYIHSIAHDNDKFVEYLQEAHKFKKEFGKDVKCCIGGEWGDEVELFSHRNQTYCQKHMPPELRREYERKITAGRHGASKDFIKR